MRFTTKRIAALAGLAIVAGLALAWPHLLRAQPAWAYTVPTTPGAQRNSLNTVRSQVRSLQNATQNAPNYVQSGYGMVWQQFQDLRGAYAGLKSTLTPNQLNYGANDFAELDAGLDILQEAFANYQDDVGAGRSPNWALRNMCQVLSQAAGVWLQEFNQDCNRLRVGW